MATPEKIPTWKIELINVYADDIQSDMRACDLFEIAQDRDNDASQQLILSAELAELI